MRKKEFLNSVYVSRTPLETKSLYDEWSTTYEETVNGHGYATPERCAVALSDFVEDKAVPILDFGCGTGISGMALTEYGFSTIDGCDISKEMLDLADEKQIYRKLWQIDPGSEINLPTGRYAHIAAIGVIGIGAAPIDVFDGLFGALPNGGSLTFSLNDHTLSDPEYEARVSEYTDTGAATVEFKEYGEHLPGLDMKSVVYILVKN
ncbi:MAG: methyltransferase domain-containing protein [Albidovulum sp.]|nr:methyltransferase domain-containing protein [Albidovulum sp.]MDE0532892.1 methyltransferase domain-containing protein [Albidovulum sp.]